VRTGDLRAQLACDRYSGAVPVAWTQTLGMRWRPLLKFYENRIPILREFEDGGSMRAFAVGENHVAARLLDAEHVLTIRQDGLTVELFGQDADVDTVCAFADTACKRLGPVELRGADTRFQHVVPIDAPFEDAVRAAIRHFRLPPVGGMGFSDWSFLADVGVEGEGTGQIEFGIIRAHEARSRLDGAGRIGARTPPERRWETTKFPDVAMFADCMWTAPKESLPNDVQAFWKASRERVSELVDALYATIGVDDMHREEQTG